MAGCGGCLARRGAAGCGAVACPLGGEFMFAILCGGVVVLVVLLLVVVLVALVVLVVLVALVVVIVVVIVVVVVAVVMVVLVRAVVAVVVVVAVCVFARVCLVVVCCWWCGALVVRCAACLVVCGGHRVGRCRLGARWGRRWPRPRPSLRSASSCWGATPRRVALPVPPRAARAFPFACRVR